MNASKSPIAIGRIIAFCVSLPLFIFLAPFSLFLFIKIRNYFKELQEGIKKTNFYDLQTLLTAAETEYASNKMKLHGFPTQYGFIGELLKLNQSKKISLQSAGNKLIIKRKDKNNLPDFLKQNDSKKMFEVWKENAENITQNRTFVLGGNYINKASIWCLVGFIFIIGFFLIIPAFIIGFFFYTFFSIPIALITAPTSNQLIGLIISLVLTVFSVFIIANLLGFIGYAILKRWNYQGKEESLKKMREEYEKSIVLNVVFNKLEEGQFKKETSINYFLMYGDYGAFAIASHAAKGLKLDNLQIIIS